MKYIYFLPFVLIFSSCLCPNPKKHQVEVIAGSINLTDSINIIDVDIPKIGAINIDEYILDVNYIPLETNKESIIGEISKIVSYRNKFYILDKITSSILVFDENGGFDSKIDKKGKGSGEYVKISDFNIDKISDQIVVLTDMPQKIIRYSLSGQLINEILPPCYTRHFAVLPDSAYAMYLEYGDNSEKIDKEFNLIITDRAGKIKTGYLPYDSKTRSDLFFKSKLHFYNSNGETYFYPDLIDTIYKVEKELITPVYSFKFGEKAFNNQILKQSIKEQDKYISSTQYCHIYSIHETQDILHFYCSYGSIMYDCYYSKKSSKFIISAITTSEKHILGNVIGSNNKYIISQIDQITMISNQKKINYSFPQLDKTLYNIIEDYKVSDNPILVTYRMDF